MALHGLGKITVGVPDVDSTIAYYTDFGLDHRGNGVFHTRDGGEQLEIVHAARRRLVELNVSADDPDDLESIASRLRRLEHPVRIEGGRLITQEPVTQTTVTVTARPRIQIPEVARTPYNGPGRIERTGRAPFSTRTGRVQPHRLGHAVLGTPDLERTRRFFIDGLGFKMSDFMEDKGAFMRCSSEHHNLLALSAPVAFLHHSSWLVDDIDEVGRGAMTMLEGHPERHIWGLGRHYAGSNFFWYLKDPAGNFSEYYSDMDTIPEDELWEPEVMHGLQGLFEWGPPPPPSFLAPEDLAELMTGNHSAA